MSKNFLPTVQAYFELKEELETFSKLRKHAFAVFDKGFDITQLEPRLESWRALCEWNSNADVKRSCNMTAPDFSVIRSTFSLYIDRRIFKGRFCENLVPARILIDEHESKLIGAKEESYTELISLYDKHAEAEKKLGFIVKDPQIFHWFMDLLQS